SCAAFAVWGVAEQGREDPWEVLYEGEELDGELSKLVVGHLAAFEAVEKHVVDGPVAQHEAPQVFSGSRHGRVSFRAKKDPARLLCGGDGPVRVFLCAVRQTIRSRAR